MHGHNGPPIGSGPSRVESNGHVTDNVNCSVIIKAKYENILLLYSFKLNFLVFTAGFQSSFILFIRTYTVSYRNALDRFRVRLNIMGNCMFAIILFMLIQFFFIFADLQQIIGNYSSG